ncbi:MAG: hypothetical protein WDO56_18235 [Gammaproteobacteria bacterium]
MRPAPRAFVEQKCGALLRRQAAQLQNQRVEPLRIRGRQGVDERAFAALLEIARHEKAGDDEPDHDHGGNADSHCGAPLARHQLVDELLRRARAIFAIELESMLDRAPLLPLQPTWAFRDHLLVARLDGRGAIEGMLAGQQFVGHAGDRIHVVARVGLEALDHLAARVGWRERAERSGVEQRRGARDVIGSLCGARDAEVEHLHHVLFGEERVRRLEVRMHDALLVGVRHCAAHVARETQGPLIAHAGAFVVADDAIERLAFEQLHHHEDVAAIAVEVVHGDDVRVRQVLRLATLPAAAP